MAFFGVCLWFVARQLRIPNRQKERIMTKAKSHSAYDPSAIAARQNYKLPSLAARIILISGIILLNSV